VEILLDPDNGSGGGPERMIHITVKVNGAATASSGVDIHPPLCAPRPLGTQVQAATRIYRDAWTAEVAIPLEAIRAKGTAAAYWGLNVCRLRAENLEYSTWSGTRTSSYHPASLGNLLAPPVDQRPSREGNGRKPETGRAGPTQRQAVGNGQTMDRGTGQPQGWLIAAGLWACLAGAYVAARSPALHRSRVHLDESLAR